MKLRPIIFTAFVAAALRVFGGEGYIFSYFSDTPHEGKRGEQAGLHLAWSRDARVFTPVNSDLPVLAPEVGDRLMRDPSITEGPDGTFHLVWTCGWKGRSIGYANSKDLVHWSAQRDIAVLENEPTARNCWAPEITYNPDDGTFYIYLSATIPGRHSPIEGMHEKESGLNHRIYLTTTKDFVTFTPSRLWFNPDFSVIDAAAVRDPKTSEWLLFVKNENHTPTEKNIRVVRGTTSLADGFDPANVSVPITVRWTEGPAPYFAKDTLFVGYDGYRNHYYGSIASTDGGATWRNSSKETKFPRGARHGTVFKVDSAVIDRLLALEAGDDKASAAATGGEAKSESGETVKDIPLSGLVLGAEKLLRYGERVKVNGTLTYLVSEGSDFRLNLDENGELTVVGVPSWWTGERIAIVVGTLILALAAAFGWALLLRHQKLAAARVNNAVQRERLRLSHDLHDGYQQLLAGCMFRLTAANSLIAKGKIEKANVQLDGLRSSLTHAQDELRAALWTMKEEAEGPAAIAELFRYAASRLPQWEGRVFFSTEGEEKPITRRYAGALLMILQEAVGNALRHGEATRVDVKFFFGRRGVAMIVKDNGCGFDTSASFDDGALHLGLLSMKSRAERIGGWFSIRSWIGRGSEVKIAIDEKMIG